MSIELDEFAQNSQNAANFLKQFSNANRLMVLCNLLEGELSVTALNQKVALSQSALSQHLASLRKAELVATRREAQTIYYRISNKDVFEQISLLHKLFC